MSAKIVFRVDSSSKIATGHVFRCLALAQKMNNPENDIIFICRNLEGNIMGKIHDAGLKTKELPRKITNSRQSTINSYLNWLETTIEEDARETATILSELDHHHIILIIDHYALDKQWETLVKQHVNKIVVIDDLANRDHDCNILIDQNTCHNHRNRYDNLVPKSCQKFLGMEYAILREQFFNTKQRKRTAVENILVSFGGIDRDNLTLKAVNAILEAQGILANNFNVTVIGSKNSYQDDIKSKCVEHGLNYINYVTNMAEIMNWADLAIGAGGTTSWERCSLNLPAIVIAIADNQTQICESLANLGIAKYLGKGAEITSQMISENLIDIFHNFNFNHIEYTSHLNQVIETILKK